MRISKTAATRFSPTASRVLSLFLVAAVVAAIFALTEQFSESTSELSQVVTGGVAEMASGADGGELAADVETFEQRGFISAELGRAWKFVRRLAHVAEFAALGASAALACLAWLSGSCRLRRMVCLAVAFCAANSLLDQLHKLLVPGREFEAVDLAFDATGYLVAIAVVLFAERAWRRRHGRHRGGVDWEALEATGQDVGVRMWEAQ